MTDQTQTGLSALEQTFATAKAEKRCTFMPFFTIGYPDLPTSLDVIQMLAEVGADAIEIGIPFSDPLADGPVIQHASQVSLDNGTTVADCLNAVKALRERGVTIPLVLMSYVNPIMAYGFERYARDAAAVGANGLIVPDLPPEEAGELAQHCVENGLALIPFLAPNSTPERVQQVTAHARGFIYMVSVTGVTGARDNLPPDLAAYAERVRSTSGLPLVFGFGISQPEHVKAIGKIADGIIVASALIRLMENGGIDAIRDLASRLRQACNL